MPKKTIETREDPGQAISVPYSPLMATGAALMAADMMGSFVKWGSQAKHSELPNLNLKIQIRV